MAVGRVGQQLLTRKLLGNIQGQIKHQEDLFEQISSNKKLLRPSDDPVGTSKAMNLRDQLDRMDEYEKQVAGANVWSNITNVALDNANEAWRRVNEIAISAADGTKTAADRAGMAEELEQLVQHLTQIANSTHNGQYIFSGSRTDTPAFRAETDPNSGRVTGVYYEGNSDLRKVKTKDQGTINVNVVGSNAGSPDVPGVFIDSQRGSNMFDSIISLRDKLLDNDTVGISGTGGILEDIEASARSLTAAQVRLGGTQEVLELDRNRIVEQSAAVEGFLSDIEQADIAALILELNNAQNTYEAALAAGGRLLQTGLINFI